MCRSRPRRWTYAASDAPSSSHSRTHDIRINHFIEVTAAGQAFEERCRHDELTSILQHCDRLVVSELSRLRRSLRQIVSILDTLLAHFSLLRVSFRR